MYNIDMQLKQLLSSELPYEEDWDQEDESVNSNSTLESADDSSTDSNVTSPTTLSTESLNQVCSIYCAL